MKPNYDNEYTKEQLQLSEFAKAMGHPARILILIFLIQQEGCFFGKIQEVLPLAGSTVSQHLKELRKAGLIKGEVGYPNIRYCIDPENMRYASLLFNRFFEYAEKGNLHRS